MGCNQRRVAHGSQSISGRTHFQLSNLDKIKELVISLCGILVCGHSYLQGTVHIH